MKNKNFSLIPSFSYYLPKIPITAVWNKLPDDSLLGIRRSGKSSIVKVLINEEKRGNKDILVISRSKKILTAFTLLSFAGSIFSGVTGISNATITFDAIIHETICVVGHFHGFILLSIVPSGFAVLYIMIPMMTDRSWYSSKLMWAHFYGYLVGALMVV